MFSNLLIACSIILFIWLIKYHWKRRRFYQISAKYSGPIALPIIGNALLFMGDNEEKLSNCMSMLEKYKSPFPIWLGQRFFLFTSDPNHLEIVLNHPNSLEKEDLYKFIKPCVGLSLLVAPVHIWKKNRKIILPTFNQKILDGFVEIFSEQSIILTEQLEKLAGKGIFDIFPLFSLFTLDSICETAMGTSINAQTTDTPFVKWVNRGMEITFSRMFTLWYHFDFIFNLTTMVAEVREYAYKLRYFTGEVIKQKKMAYQQQLKAKDEAQFDEVPQKRNTFLQQFIELSAAGNHMTDTEMLDEVMLMLIAGTETTASVNSYTTMMLGMHPDLQEKVYMEVIDVIGKDKPIEYTDLPKLYYTEMFIKETMRLFPVGPLIVRALTGDIQLGESVIPAGTSVVLGILRVHRDPNLWPDPLRFDPLRFLPEECAKRRPYTYLPFSLGPRNCIGLKYAMMAMKVVIAEIVRTYHIKCNYKCIEDIRLKQDMVLKPAGGYDISIEKRS